MRDSVSLRRALPDDLEFCQGHHDEAMKPALERLQGWDQAREDEAFQRQWALREVSIILCDGMDVGWIQSSEANRTIFLKQLHLARDFRNRRIGMRVLWGLLDNAKRRGLPVMTTVLKDSPARRFFDRLGFRQTHQDEHRIYLKREPTA